MLSLDVKRNSTGLQPGAFFGNTTSKTPSWYSLSFRSAIAFHKVVRLTRTERAVPVGILSINPYTMTVTPDIAAAWLTFNFDRQRPINELSVRQLAEAMRRNTFTTNTIKFAVFGDRRVLINGQHTLTAIMRSGKTLVLPVQDMAVSSEDDIGNLYYHEDIQRRRSFADSIRAVAGEDRFNLTRTQIKQVGAALKWIRAGFGVSRSEYAMTFQDDLLEWIPNWSWECRQLYRAITPCDGDARNMIIQQASMSIALITFRYQPEKANEFWRQVAQDDGLRSGDPRKTIHRFLRTTKRASMSAARVDPRRISRRIAHAWNAFCEGRDLQISQVQDPTKLLIIAGTPYNGNQGTNFLPLSASPNLVKEMKAAA